MSACGSSFRITIVKPPDSQVWRGSRTALGRVETLREWSMVPDSDPPKPSIVVPLYPGVIWNHVVVSIDNCCAGGVTRVGFQRRRQTGS
jgi:hypothetical protein